MSTTALRNRVKKAVDRLSEDQLFTVADFVGYVSKRAGGTGLNLLIRAARMKARLDRSLEDFAAGKGTKWREVRRDV